MTDSLTFNYSVTSKNKIVPLNQDIGYLLVKYLKGLDVINFMEVSNGSEQFGTIEITEEKSFHSIFTRLLNEKKLRVDIPYLDFYSDTCSIDDEGYVYSKQFYGEHAPLPRLFIHGTFTNNAFEHLCSTYKTSSFQCYVRLLPLNTHVYAGHLMLVDYFGYKNSIGCARRLNAYEKNLFKECLFFRSMEQDAANTKLSFVESIAEFTTNFESRFKSSLWVEAIDFKEFHISGGCLVNSLCKVPFIDTTTQQVDINFHGNSFDSFDDAMDTTFNKLSSTLLKNGYHLSIALLKKNCGLYQISLPFDVTLCFHFKHLLAKGDCVSYILHGSDLDISQVAFTGSKVMCTVAFLQAMATKSFLCYTMHEDIGKDSCDRIIRYCRRGFVFLEPHGFDNMLYFDILANDPVNEKREETRELLDEDGEVQIVTITYYPRICPLPNVDTYRLQESFIKQMCCKKV